MSFKRIQQPDNWSCGACCAAMIVGKDLNDFIEFVGHDGSELNNKSIHPDKRRGFEMIEILRYLNINGYWVGAIWAWDDDVIDDSVIASSHLAWEFNKPALVVVDSIKLPPPYKHVIFWDGKKVWDPSSLNQSLDSYKVVEWWPVVKFGEQP